MPQRQLVLSSSSPARKQLLKRLYLPFECNSPDVDETPKLEEPIEELVKRLAIAKALASAIKFPEALIIGCDQVGCVDKVFLTKPLTKENAKSQLLLKSGRWVKFYTGLCLLDARTGIQQVSIECYEIQIRTLTAEMIEHYLEKENVLECAGSMNIEGLGITLINKMRGDDYTSIIGLPLIRLSEMLKNVGVSLL